MPLDLLPMLSAFTVVALAELGDKTQFAVICLSANHRTSSVFTGALLAFALVDGISALVGGVIAPFIPTFWIGLIAGIAFIAFGVYTLFSRENAAVNFKEHSKAVTTSFLLIGIMELGDKTQFAVIALSAEYGAPFQVFIGIMLAFILLTAVGAVFGKAISKYLSARYVKVGVALMFIAFGVVFLYEALTGVKLF